MKPGCAVSHLAANPTSSEARQYPAVLLLAPLYPSPNPHDGPGHQLLPGEVTAGDTRSRRFCGIFLVGLSARQGPSRPERREKGVPPALATTAEIFLIGGVVLSGAQRPNGPHQRG